MRISLTGLLIVPLVIGLVGCTQKTSPASTTITAGKIEPSPLEQLEAAGAKVERGDKVTKVHFRGTRFTDEEMRLLVAVPDVSWLTLEKTAVTVKGIDLLTKVSSLRGLGLAGENVTNDTIRHIAEVKQIDTLEVYDTRITLGGWSELAGMRGLRWLYVISDRVGDDVLVSIAKLRHLVLLNLYYSGVTDRGLAALAGMGLDRLFIPPKTQTKVGLGNYLRAIKSPPARRDLSCSPLSDAHLEVLADCGFENLDLPERVKTDLGLKNYLKATRKPITTLHLDGWNITDAGLRELHSLPDLKEVTLIGTKVMPAGIAPLKKKHPGLVCVGPLQTRGVDLLVAPEDKVAAEKPRPRLVVQTSHPRPVVAFVFRMDGKRFVTICIDGTARV